MGDSRSVEWTSLGARLASLCPEKFDEIVDALRETVAVHELLRGRNWSLAGDDVLSLEAAKA